MVSGSATAVLLAGLVVALAVAIVVGIAVGTVDLPVTGVWDVIWAHATGSTSNLNPLNDEIIWTIRTPRVLLAAVVGAGLSIAGTSLQALVRNPLADPYILGVAAGASVGAALVLAYGSGATFGLGVSGAAFAGALISLVLVFLLAQRSGGLGGTRLVLAGVALGYLCTAVTSYVQLQATQSEVVGIMFWLMGSVAGATWGSLGIPAAAIVVCSIWLLLQARNLNALMSGDDAAAGLGVDVHRLRIGLLFVSSLLTATVVAVAGGVGFVGLMIPHMARFLVGGDHRRVLPVSALMGALFLVVVDIGARTVDKPNDLPLGIFTAAVGVPFFLWLLRRRPGGAA